ncbi:MAG TPA: hypothetical protein VFR87_17145, partial [Nocardioidaceae bacterium]|nr:hypothetical protein [Nocardioidaceae bacterium]
AVRASARRLQHRRRVVTGVVAAAVTSIALPTGVAVTGALDDNGNGDGPGYAASPTAEPTPQPTPEATQRPADQPAGEVLLTLDGIPRGADPAIDYLNGDQLVLADGRVVQLEKEYQEIAPVEDGWVGLANDEGDLTRELIDSDGNVTDRVPSSWGLATNIDGSQVAFVQVENGEWRIFDVTVDGMEPRTTSNPSNQPQHPVGYVGDGALVYNTGEQQTEVRVFERSAEDYELPAKPRFINASGTSEAAGLVAGMTESRIDGSCSAVVSYQTGAPSFETCDHLLGQFSPDGRYVIGTPAYADGLGPRSLAILDADTGEVVVSFDPPRDSMIYLGDPVWEDDEHVVTTATDGLDSYIVRFGVDGSMESASAKLAVEEYGMPSPVHFAARP